jgi:hypothetical protein
MFKKLLISGILAFCILINVSRGKCDTNIIKTYEVENDTASTVTSYVSASTIVPNQSLIHGFSIGPTRANSYSPLASLWDESASTAHSTSNLFGESEATANTSKDKPFPYPKMISTQVKVVLGPYTAIIIEYTK